MHQKHKSVVTQNKLDKTKNPRLVTGLQTGLA